jgi:hypothetical protein
MFTPHGCGSLANCVDNVLIPGAPAHIAFQSMTDLLVTWIRICAKQFVRSQNHSRRAIPALKAVFIPERFLKRMQLAVAGQAFDCRYGCAIGLDRQSRAGFNSHTIHQDCASTALACVAADLRSRNGT